MRPHLFSHPHPASGKPHVSGALKQLRGWVTLVALGIALCGATQAFVFAFAQYTTLRWTHVQVAKSEPPMLRVVGAVPSSAGTLPTGTNTETQAAAGGATPDAAIDHVITITPARAAFTLPRKVAEAPLRVLSHWDKFFAHASGLACAAGVLGCLGLCMLTWMGVVVAGGGSVPGVERVVTAGVWSMVMAFLCLPWATWLPGLHVPGIFAGYGAMTTVVDATPETNIYGSFGAIAQWVAAPLITAFAAMGVCIWFRAGVEAGVIISSPSQLDRAIEREASNLAKQGATASTPRSVGALNRAIGDASLESALDIAATEANGLVKDAHSAAELSGKQARSVADAGFKRLI